MNLFASVLLFLIITQSALANTNSNNSEIRKPIQQKILPLEAALKERAEHKIWRGLLHYFDTGFPSKNFTSQVNDQDFFISDEGATNPFAELMKTMEIFTAPTHPDHQKYACQFPARFHWLQQEFPNSLPAMPNCKAFEDFLEKVNAEKVFIVFPAAYLNSPSSMFGHTFLRLKAAHRNNPLLDYAVNFAANADDSENTILYSLRGLSGGYPGQFSVVPFYDKIKEYSFLDSRDIWEYELKLTDKETKQLVRHIWELQQIQFDYYFLTENCSYRLVTLLSAISDRIDANGEYRFRAVPTDTLRFLSKTPGFGDIQYRPSQVTKLRAAQTHIKQQDLDLIQHTVLDANADPFTLLHTENPKASLNLAYDYARYVAAKEKRNLRHLSARTLKLLSLRAQQKTDDYSHQTPEHIKPATTIATPKVRDEQGHETLTFTAQRGQNKTGDFLNLGIRGAYHDLLDPPAGYPAGAQLVLFDLQLRQFIDQNKTTLERLAFVDIFSNTPVDQLVKPRSWRVGFGLQYFDIEQTHGGFFDAGIGKTWMWHNISLSALGVTSVGLLSDTGFISAGPSLQ